MVRHSQDIETIIKSFETYALGDINHNKCKPIAAFILSVCFIDQLSSFRYDYKIKYSKRAPWIFRDYMKAYSRIGSKIYEYFRNGLIHNYSSKGQFDIDNVGHENVAYEDDGNIIYINTNVFIEHLKNAFTELCVEFRDPNSQAHKNALETSKHFPVFADTRQAEANH